MLFQRISIIQVLHKARKSYLFINVSQFTIFRFADSWRRGRQELIQDVLFFQ